MATSTANNNGPGMMNEHHGRGGLNVNPGSGNLFTSDHQVINLTIHKNYFQALQPTGTGYDPPWYTEYPTDAGSQRPHMRGGTSGNDEGYRRQQQPSHHNQPESSSFSLSSLRSSVAGVRDPSNRYSTRLPSLPQSYYNHDREDEYLPDPPIRRHEICTTFHEHRQSEPGRRQRGPPPLRRSDSIRSSRSAPVTSAIAAAEVPRSPRASSSRHSAVLPNLSPQRVTKGGDPRLHGIALVLKFNEQLKQYTPVDISDEPGAMRVKGPPAYHMPEPEITHPDSDMEAPSFDLRQNGLVLPEDFDILSALELPRSTDRYGDYLRLAKSRNVGGDRVRRRQEQSYQRELKDEGLFQIKAEGDIPDHHSSDKKTKTLMSSPSNPVTAETEVLKETNDWPNNSIDSGMSTDCDVGLRGGGGEGTTNVSSWTRSTMTSMSVLALSASAGVLGYHTPFLVQSGVLYLREFTMLHGSILRIFYLYESQQHRSFGKPRNFSVGLITRKPDLKARLASQHVTEESVLDNAVANFDPTSSPEFIMFHLPGPTDTTLPLTAHNHFNHLAMHHRFTGSPSRATRRFIHTEHGRPFSPSNYANFTFGCK
ncbi:hypothetical protein V8F33_004866 [Rhypophila sp. PSN 637]